MDEKRRAREGGWSISENHILSLGKKKLKCNINVINETEYAINEERDQLQS